MCWHGRPVRDIPKSTAADAEETLDTAEAQQEQDNVTSEVPAVSSATYASDASEAALLLDEASQQTMDVDAAQSDTEQPASTDDEAPADFAPPEQPTAEPVELEAPQKDVVQSFSNEYIRAVIPNIDSMFAENDFSSLDARKRWAVS